MVYAQAFNDFRAMRALLVSGCCNIPDRQLQTSGEIAVTVDFYGAGHWRLTGRVLLQGRRVAGRSGGQGAVERPVRDGHLLESG